VGDTSVVMETAGEFQAELTLSVGEPKVRGSPGRWELAG
jgi:hypothetical protein